jgi:ParB-like chromosome segregation protein Spo0J
MPASLEGAQRRDAFLIAPEYIDQIEDPLDLKFGLRDIEDLAWKIVRSPTGQHTPVLVRKNAQKRTQMIDGRRRRAAIQMINANLGKFEQTAPRGLLARLIDCTEDEAIELQRTANADRENKPSAVDDAFAVRKLEDTLGWERSKVCQVLRLHPSRACRLKTLFRLPLPVLQLVHEGKIRESHAYQLLGLEDHEIRVFADRFEAGEKASEILKQIKESHRSAGRLKARSRAEVVKEVEGLGGPLGADLVAWLKGDPTVGSLQDILGRAWWKTS